MFKNLQETIKSLNADAKNVANSEKAKKLRKKLLTIGLPMAISGYFGMFICFASFATAGFNAVGSGGISTSVMIPFFLLLPCAVIGSIGSTITSLGFKIIITGYTTNLINETVGNNCPNCGETINSEMYFCSKCGAKLRKECSNCKNINNYKSDYCEKCGTRLN